MAVSLTIVGTRDAQVEDLVRGSGRISTVAWISDAGALVDAEAEQPGVLLIDVRGGHRVPPELSGLKRQHPATNVVLLASALDPGLMLEGMRAGVNEYLTEPLKQEEFDAAIARLLGHRSQVAGDHVFAFIGAKGGVGTTTTAVNVATVLAKLSKRPTLLVDLHLAYGDAGVFLGADPRFSLLDALENMHRLDAEFLKSLVVRTASNVELLASADRPATAAINMRNLDAVVRLASSQYTYTMLDVPRSDLLVLDCLDRVDTIVVVANQELATVRNAGHMTAALRSRYPDAKVMTVISKFDARAEISQRDVEKAVGSPIALEFPSDYRLALSAMHKGRPLALDNHNQLSASMTTLARALAGIKQEKTGKSSGGIKGLLSGRR
ncbi:MAG TPA: AAA family ATPase [Vicinamibacterales bacterium]|nr:AAA family ATPase [Vicinamibacterales bacterium]